MIDIGANLLNGQFHQDLDAVLARAWAAGLEHLIVTATNPEDAAAAIELCAAHDNLSCTAGVHPHHAGEVHATGGDWLEQIRALAANEQVCAIGETGLDFYRNFSPPAAQRAVFAAQVELAAELELPLFVHDRDSQGAVHDILIDRAERLPAVVIHCFTGSEEDLVRYLDAGFCIGVTGWVCDQRRGSRLRELVLKIPLERLLIETDAPFLLPHGAASPTAQKRRNEPCLLPFIAAYIAELLQVSTAEVADRTAANARRLFRLGSVRHPDPTLPSGPTGATATAARA